MFHFKPSNLTINLIHLGMKAYTKDRVRTKLYSYLFMLPLNKLFFFIALANIGKLDSVEDAPFASLREGR